MSVQAGLGAEFDRWVRKESLVFQVAPYCLMAVSVVMTLLLLQQQPVRLPVVLGLSAAATLWVLWFHTLRRGRHRRSMGLYFTGLMALTAGLAAFAPWYGFFAFAGYSQAFHYLKGRWRYVGAAANATVSALALMGGAANINSNHLWWAWVAVSLISILLAWVLFSFVDTADHRDDRQQQALVELHETNARLETTLAENAGLHAQLLAQAREAGVADERQRMAREIHDTLAQGLAGILTQLQAAEQALDDPSTVRRRLANAMSLARENLTEARRTVHAVEPAVLVESRLPDAINAVTRQWSEVNGIDAVLTTTGDARAMHTDVEVALLRTAQEALANVAKHARASRVGLTLSYMEDLVSLDVRDDGVGFEPNGNQVNVSCDGGFGLAGMRQRVQRLAGRLTIESEPGVGTAISAAVPAIPAGGAD